MHIILAPKINLLLKLAELINLFIVLLELLKYNSLMFFMFFKKIINLYAKLDFLFLQASKNRPYYCIKMDTIIEYIVGFL